MAKVTIYHNPRCNKSRQTLKLLTDNGVEPDIVEYLKTPPDEKTLERIGIDAEQLAEILKEMESTLRSQVTETFGAIFK